MDELLRFLWAYRTTSWKLIGVSPFALTYGLEAIISTKFGVPTLRTEILEEANIEVITKDLDMTNELREVAVVRITSYQQRITNLCNMQVKQHVFRAGDLVLRKVFENTTNPTAGKFQSN